MKTLPVTSDPSQRFAVDLEGKLVSFTIRFGNLTRAWMFDLETEEDGVILRGQRLVLGTNMLRAYNLELGGLFCYAVRQTWREPCRYCLGTRVLLVHFTRADLDAAVQA